MQIEDLLKLIYLSVGLLLHFLNGANELYSFPDYCKINAVNNELKKERQTDYLNEIDS